MTGGQGRASLAFLLRKIRTRNRPEAVIDRHYVTWLARHGTPDRATWAARLAATPATPGISVIMPVCDPRPDWLAEAIASVRGQFHGGWELLIADDASLSAGPRATLQAATAADPRIRVVWLARRSGISAASNAALAMARMPYVTFLDHDDRLAPHALAAMACALAAHPETELAFSDEDQLVEDRRARPYFKPGWNPDLLLSQNLVCHLAVYRRALVTRLGGLRPAFDGSQDLDLALRAVREAGTDRVHHVPDVLYHWRQSAGSFSAVAAPACRDATRRSLQEALGAGHAVLADPVVPQWPQVRFAVPDPAPGVAVIGGRIDGGCYPATLVSHVHRAEQHTGADILLFLSDRLVPVTRDWLRTLVAQASRPEIGAVGARLEGPDGRILHAGYVLDTAEIVQSPLGRADPADPGYRGQFHLARTVSAVSGDCLAVRRSVFEAAGGLCTDAGDFAAVDLCLKLAALGLRNVWAPQARLRYTRAPLSLRSGAAWMRARWAGKLADDPYFNAHLRLRHGCLLLAK